MLRNFRGNRNIYVCIYIYIYFFIYMKSLKVIIIVSPVMSSLQLVLLFLVYLSI